jgi:hypothetical protein
VRHESSPVVTGSPFTARAGLGGSRQASVEPLTMDRPVLDDLIAREIGLDAHDMAALCPISDIKIPERFSAVALPSTRSTIRQSYVSR